MKFAVIIALVAILTGCTSTKKQQVTRNIYDIEVTSIAGETTTMEQYKGKVLLIVNTASQCGFTKQYEGLQELYTEYENKGLLILGFPSNDFFKQEPGTDEEIAEFCKNNYSVTFPMFSKISVKGKKQHPLYSHLTAKDQSSEFGGKVSWNFTKFLISPHGEVIGRFGSMTKPSDPKLISAIEQALQDAGLIIQTTSM